jgi:hypothetical protein
MFHILIRLRQQIGHSNCCGNPNEPRVGNFHLVSPVEEVKWCDADKC